MSVVDSRPAKTSSALGRSRMDGVGCKKLLSSAAQAIQGRQKTLARNNERIDIPKSIGALHAPSPLDKSCSRPIDRFTCWTRIFVCRTYDVKIYLKLIKCRRFFRSGKPEFKSAHKFCCAHRPHGRVIPPRLRESASPVDIEIRHVPIAIGELTTSGLWACVFQFIAVTTPTDGCAF